MKITEGKGLKLYTPGTIIEEDLGAYDVGVRWKAPSIDTEKQIHRILADCAEDPALGPSYAPVIIGLMIVELTGIDHEKALDGVYTIETTESGCVTDQCYGPLISISQLLQEFCLEALGISRRLDSVTRVGMDDDSAKN